MKIKKTLKSIASILIVLLPVLRYYRMPFIDISIIYIFIGLIFALMIVSGRNKKLIYLNNQINMYYIFHFMYLSIISIVVMLVFGFSLEFSKIFFLIIMINLVIILCMMGWIDYETLIVAYKTIAIFTCLYILLQFVLYNMFGFALSGKIALLTISDNWYDKFWNTSFGVFTPMDGYKYCRFSGIFIEPSHAAIYLMPFLCMKMFGFKQYVYRNLLHAIIISMVLLITLSGFAVVLTMVLWLFNILYLGGGHLLKKFVIISIGFIILYGCLQVLLTNEGFLDIISKLFVSDSTGGSKSDARIYRGFLIYLNIPALYKIIGIGYGNILNAVEYFNISTVYDAIILNNPEYTNAIVKVLLYTGLIGTIPLGIYFIKLFKHTEMCMRVLIIVFIAICLAAETYMETIWIIYIVFISGSIIYKDPDVKRSRCNLKIFIK